MPKENKDIEKEGKFDGTIVTLVDEDGNDMEFEHLDTAEIGTDTYVALVPVIDEVDEDEDSDEDFDGELVLLKVVVDEKGAELLVAIDNEAEFNHVAKIFEERLSEEFDFKE